MKKIKHLYYKDLAGFRLIGMLLIFSYIIMYLLATNDRSDFSIHALAYTSEFADVGLSLFVLLSSFLITVQGLREYKYTKSFSLRKFYIRRLLKVAPILIIGLLFYFFIHPLLINFLKLTSLEGSNSIKNLLFFPTYHGLLRAEVFIYAYILYNVLLISFFYLVWGFVLKYLQSILPLISILLIVGGVFLKFLYINESNSFEHYILYYIFEVGIGAALAVIFRKQKNLVDWIKKLSHAQIVTFYITVISIILLWFFVLQIEILSALIKMVFTLLIACMIMEQTFAKHSILKLRDIKVIMRLGKLSYNMIVLSPIIAVIILIAIESLDRSITAPIIKVVYPIITLLITWLLADIFYKYISKFFIRMQSDFKPLK
ncbi:hypothetical protein DNU06_00320 [Putridiphycobacter roseus]|uniref:Acyltransferase 3 domain-containing protein n=1 Tax=Putridiphycobacter roseus TaxID=2219161 RepID=A0A2W1N367_9FLAO|nr:acyltransferase family protein [Putridiphycobacter roseus]PZE18314.1 hypothetical protein DNU06_00320 [Putridiphycobacter roseus]